MFFPCLDIHQQSADACRRLWRRPVSFIVCLSLALLFCVTHNIWSALQEDFFLFFYNQLSYSPSDRSVCGRGETSRWQKNGFVYCGGCNPVLLSLCTSTHWICVCVCLCMLERVLCHQRLSGRTSLIEDGGSLWLCVCCVGEAVNICVEDV